MNAVAALSGLIDRLNERVGSAVAWLAVALVVLQFALVLMRYVYGKNFIFLQESLLYMHGTLFLIAAGYTLLHNGHVRVDLLYREASERTKARVNLLGGLFLLIPVCGLLWWAAWPFVEAAWQSREGSIETSGLPIKYLYKSVILVFVALLGLQGLSQTLKAIIVLRGAGHMSEEEAPAL